MTDIAACVDFLQRLIQTPSMPGEEGALAELVASEMTHLGYDTVDIDEAGNVIGYIKGRGEAPPVMFNTHLDHVDVGDPDAWPHPPFGGEVHEGAVWGRGAVDIKGPLAAQVHGVARLKADAQAPPGDVYVTGVVQEEVGGVGALHLLTHLRPSFVVVGEASQNGLRRGHRGRLELVIHVTGRSVHASAPDRGANPLQVAARFISGISNLSMEEDPDLGRSTVAVTDIRTDQDSTNVIPSEVWLTCDWRNVPGETEEDVQARLQQLADESLIPGTTARVEVPVFPRETYTGMKMPIPASNYPFIIRESDPALRAARQILSDAVDGMTETDYWRFATDGGHFSRAGLTVLGFGPGDEALAHTVDEHVPIAQLADALDGYEALARSWTAAIRHHPHAH